MNLNVIEALSPLDIDQLESVQEYINFLILEKETTKQ